MEFVNETKMEAGWTLGFEPDGRELLVVVVKGTFTIPHSGEEPALTENQIPLTEADEFTGEPGSSATLYETDYAHRKPMCDVLLNGSAYAPGGRPAKRVNVSFQVGSMKKSFHVVGDRIWKRKLFWIRPTSPKPFTIMPISYDRAFGGTDIHPKNPEKIKTYLKNPIGIGYYPLTKRKALIGKPLSNTEKFGQKVKKVKGKYQPMSFGPISRNFESRFPYAGTYDKDWLDCRAPFFPDNFDYRYFQSAPLDQQIPYPLGKEEIALLNLTPDKISKFCLPQMTMPILFIPFQGKAKVIKAVIDTIVLEPDEGRFMLTWRVSLPLQRNMFEMERVVVGKTIRAFHHEIRRAGKTHYTRLGELVRETRRRRQAVS